MSDVNTRSTAAPTLTTQPSVEPVATATPTPTLVYDGECEFCTACVRFLARRTILPLASVAYQSADLAALGLTREECADAVQWVADGRTVSAHLAVAAALRHARMPWPLAGIVISLPGIRRVAAATYRKIAARRRCAAPTPPAG